MRRKWKGGNKMVAVVVVVVESAEESVAVQEEESMAGGVKGDLPGMCAIGPDTQGNTLRHGAARQKYGCRLAQHFGDFNFEGLYQLAGAINIRVIILLCLLCDGR